VRRLAAWSVCMASQWSACGQYGQSVQILSRVLLHGQTVWSLSGQSVVCVVRVCSESLYADCLCGQSVCMASQWLACGQSVVSMVSLCCYSVWSACGQYIWSVCVVTRISGQSVMCMVHVRSESSCVDWLCGQSVVSLCCYSVWSFCVVSQWSASGQSVTCVVHVRSESSCVDWLVTS